MPPTSIAWMAAHSATNMKSALSPDIQALSLTTLDNFPFLHTSDTYY